MILEIIGFLLGAIFLGIIALVKATGDIFPFELKRALSKLVLSNWVNSLPSILPVYNLLNPKTAHEAGILANETEWELEKPRTLQTPHEIDDLLIYGVDDKGNCILAKISKMWGNQTQVIIVLCRNGETFSVKYEGVAENNVEFTLGNFKLELVEPFRTWRVWFNGYMEKQGSFSENDLVHITLNFLWKPLDEAKDFRKDANILLLSKSLSEGRYGQTFANLKEIVCKGYSQFGSLHGFVRVDGDNEEGDAMYLYGFRTRRHLQNDCDNNIIEFFAMKNIAGDALRLVSSNGIWVDGEGLYGSMQTFPIKEVDVSPTLFAKTCMFPKLFEVQDEKTSQRIEIWPKYEQINIKDSLEVVLLQAEINGAPARGILLRGLNKCLAVENNFKPYRKLENAVHYEEDFVSLNSEACLELDLVGGKAASLAKLSFVNKSLDFHTARGFSTTTKLFKNMVKTEVLRDIFNQENADLNVLCSQAMNYVTRKEIVEKLSPLLNVKCREIFGESRTSLKFAVRSSGVLEDGSDLSCAGQNETFLGVDETSIAEKVVECWASLFTLQSVTYRLNHGQPAVTEMGVVVQEMVNAAAAGVLFSADPRTGNPFEILITANFGLGESVVSGSCDPDCIIVKRQRSKDAFKNCQEEHLLIQNTIVGAKKSKIVVNANGKFTEEKILSDEDSKRLCLDNSQILKLGLIGCKIETEMGQFRPVDVEWAINQEGKIYVLQSRLVTSLHAWTDFEIMHQFDTAIRTRIERLTTANTGEVMPKPGYPISMQSMSRNLDLGVQSNANNGDPICPLVARTCPIYCNRFFISVYPTLYRKVDPEISVGTYCADLTVFGRPLITKEVHKVAVERYGVMSGKDKLVSLIQAIKIIANATKRLEKANSQFGNWTFKVENNAPPTIQSVYDQITKSFIDIKQAFIDHCSMSAASSTSLVFAFISLTEGKNAEDWTPSIYEDTGKLLSACSIVESAEFPTDMEHLADDILQFGGDVDKFLILKDTKESISWLKANEKLVTGLEKFFEKHGHRSVSELDIGQDSWRTDPSPFITLLKNIVRNKIKSSAQINHNRARKTLEQSEDDLLESLKTPLKRTTKWFLKFILPHCRRMVIYRERTKSLTVRILDQIKQAYAILGELMTQARLIPDTKLIKHLTHHEIGLLIERHYSSSAILYRATRRLRLYPVLEELDFPEISVGIPTPLNKMQQWETSFVVKGTPVSAGKIKGTVKVCLSVEEASEKIEEGDILITKGTDIAWSPFFPILGGVVTELGGLISHGAVVAREYGLPCIVGAINATKIFQSGDQVILDTSSGTISKVTESKGLID